MKKFLSIIKKMIVLVTVIVLTTVGVQIVYGIAEPGSQEDPIISQSYLEEIVVPQIYEYINEKIGNLAKKVDDLEQKVSGLDNQTPSEQGSSQGKFTVVSVKAGQKLIGGAGTELILRMGDATVIATPKGGLADTTQGKDLQNGQKMPPNHLLIIPLEDGRGFTANQDVLVMVKGTYVIQ